MKHVHTFESFVDKINEAESSNKWVRAFAKAIKTANLGDGSYTETRVKREYSNDILRQYPHLKGSADRWQGLSVFNVNFDGLIEFHEITGLKIVVNNPRWEAIYHPHLQDSGYNQHMEPEESITSIIKEIKNT